MDITATIIAVLAILNAVRLARAGLTAKPAARGGDVRPMRVKPACVFV